MNVIVRIELLPATGKVLYSADLGGLTDPTPEDMAVVEILRKHLEAAFAEIAKDVAHCKSYHGVAVAAGNALGVSAANKLHTDAREKEREREG